MRKILIFSLIFILSLGLGCLAGRVFYNRKSAQIAAELDLKSHTLWRLGKQGEILQQMKAGHYTEAIAAGQELKLKQHLFDTEFKTQIDKAKWAAWGIGGATSLLSLLLAVYINKLFLGRLA